MNANDNLEEVDADTLQRLEVLFFLFIFYISAGVGVLLCANDNHFV